MTVSPNPQYVMLTPATPRTFDLSALAFTLGPLVVKVYTDGAVTQKVYFTTDGTTPTTDGDSNWCLLGGQAGWKTAEVVKTAAGLSQVKLLSAGAAWVCVEAYAKFRD